ncbi:histone-lysine N-methyltransferase PRDM9-like [Amphibalanus amphitrite]|uniref:histone-lysine N-methyltransferase PRDM9-like n=1 Tax=Amphibalanus amphitrite TaxID=1232801 RepID=UPI001C90453B|nr:histone-lysine N-methyltransferase PRDM9-like [Amphibalanus amphitrite]XP_043224931.1 histone-lysine N-methyltransferase PRDM9-like [Amphibalanus amphitrite]XP_043224932.1 histone-lysine N-methyltransferase PRDM9-like [Amphibalanus amphitrite]XP_043224933.1 histone-lysine N-methyltransferase PRDM9-like [Amphibalanus amphitrite]XP_043224934.1 histone-lysine N-methyltransferase PRDM9-like [Amphibalanus amphitrite]XP_043224935.1 histone-lysine N-methyltransferase PRDM9-like [Amphibalanus amphi
MKITLVGSASSSVAVGAADDVPLAADLVQETTELSVSGEPDVPLDGAVVSLAPSTAVSSSALDTAGASGVSKPVLQNANFRVVKVTNAPGESVEETIQKYVSNVTANGGGGGGSGGGGGGSTITSGGQQIIILKYADPDEVKVKSEPVVQQATRRELQQTDDGLWMEVEVPIGAEVNVNQQNPDQQTIIVEEMPMYFTEGGQVIEYQIAADDAKPEETAVAAGTSAKRRHLVLDSTNASPSKRHKKDALLTTSSPYHKCPDCGEEFVAKYKLLAHRKIHDGKQPYACGQCGEMFPVKNMLANHLMQHSGELTCTFCSRVLSTKRSLQRHIAQHTGEKEYKCTQCDKDFFDRIQLVEHMRTHTGEKPFACQVCGTAFARNSNLLAHMRIHRDEKPYHCAFCGRLFRWRNNMVLHQKKHLESGEVDALMDAPLGDGDEVEPAGFHDESNGTEASN